MDEQIEKKDENVEEKIVQVIPDKKEKPSVIEKAIPSLSFFTIFSLIVNVVLSIQNADMHAKVRMEQQKWSEIQPYLASIQCDLPIYEEIKKNIINESGIFTEEKLTYIVDNYFKGENVGGEK